MTELNSQIEAIYSESYGRVLATLISNLRDFDLAEDVLQEAFITAFETWPRDGIPRQPAAWLTTTARRKAIDRIRRAENLQRKNETLKQLIELNAHSAEYQNPALNDDMYEIPDERLKLIFTCCHPSIALEAQVALTLRTLGGLDIEEIARSFLVPRTTMQQRIVRAKRKIKKAGIPYRVPPKHLLDERVNAVLAVVYLIFNAGYTATQGEALVKHELCDEAIRLGNVLANLMPLNAEVLGILALMVLHHARRDARSTDDGAIILLADQDRTSWDHDAIGQASMVLERAMTLRQPGPYQIQAAIAALHCDADSAESTDWPQIAALYHSLKRYMPSPVVALNHAVAVAMADGPMRGLALLEELEGEGKLDQYHLFHAARADFLRRAGWHDRARAAYEDALALTDNQAEQTFLQMRLAELAEDDNTQA